MSDRSIKKTLHTLRLVASFALLGAVVAGAVFGGYDMDLRPFGAAMGAGSVIAYKVFQLF